VSVFTIWQDRDQNTPCIFVWLLSDANLALQHHVITAHVLQKGILLEANMKGQDLATMSVDQLWTLHEEIIALLSSKIDAEKRELERRLALLQGRIEDKPSARRPYPKVHPKYRNPERPSETWSGRGKQPRWVGAQLKSGKKFDELLIARTH
jgi:DNA-binding protein H-NS